MNNNQSDIDDQIAVARNEWTKSHNDELEKRLFNSIGEVRRVWDEEKKLKIKEVIHTTIYTSVSFLSWSGIAKPIRVSRQWRFFVLF